ncbi:MAG: tetratricopeptide repeat protein [Spirochaetales bacterium]|nr:tetratricopeptide repeat protein [Spirochaetales bacterium]
MSEPDDTIIADTTLSPSPPGKIPWNPKVFIVMSILFSFGASGILAGINWRRLGKPALTWPTIIFSQSGLIVFIIILSFLPPNLNETIARLVGYGINIAIGRWLAGWQESAYKEWTSQYGEPKPGKAGFLIPLVSGIASIALVLLLSFGIDYWFISGPVNAGISHFNKALELQQQNRLDKAIEEYTKAIEINPELSEAYYNRAHIHFEQNKYDRAINDITEYINRNPEDADGYFQRGILYKNTGSHEKAVADLEKAIASGLDSDLEQQAKALLKDDSEYFTKAMEHFNNGEFKEAIAGLTKAIEINPDDAINYLLRGTCYYTLRELDNAIADLTQAIKLNPAYYEAYHNRSMVYSSKEEYDKALEDINKAISLQSTDPMLYHARGMIYGNMKKYDKALENFNKALQIAPDRDGVLFSRGLLYYEMKMMEKAKIDIRKAIVLNPENLTFLNETKKRFPEFDLELE